MLPFSSNQKPDSKAETEDNEDSTFSINMSGGRSQTVESPYKSGRIGGKGFPDWKSLIASTSTVDVDSSVALRISAPISTLESAIGRWRRRVLLGRGHLYEQNHGMW